MKCAPLHLTYDLTWGSSRLQRNKLKCAIVTVISHHRIIRTLRILRIRMNRRDRTITNGVTMRVPPKLAQPRICNGGEIEDCFRDIVTVDPASMLRLPDHIALGRASSCLSDASSGLSGGSSAVFTSAETLRDFFMPYD